MKNTKAQYGITFFVLILSTVLLTGQRAQGATKWVKKIVSVPYTYYEYETQTRYRLVRKAFTVTEYRYETRAVTTYRYERQRVAVEVPGRCHGVTRIKYVWKDVKVPETTYETVRVPYQKTVYKTVSEPYYVRVRVERTGYRDEVQWVKVYVPDRKFTRDYAHYNYRDTNWKYSSSGFTLQIGLGGNNRGRKHDSIRGRDHRETRRDSSTRNFTSRGERQDKNRDDKKHKAVRDRDHRETRRDYSRTVESRTRTGSNRRTEREASRRTLRDRSSRTSRDSSRAAESRTTPSRRTEREASRRTLRDRSSRTSRDYSRAAESRTTPSRRTEREASERTRGDRSSNNRRRRR